MDPNLRLALIDEVYAARLGYHWVSETLQTAYEASEPSTPWAVYEEQIEPMPELEALIRGLPVEPAELAAIERLELDGDRDVYTTCPYWWDFGDHFVIRDLAGLSACTSLRELSLGQGLVDACALAPLRALAQLERLSLCTSSGFVDPAALLELPAVREVEVYNVATAGPEWGPVLEQLRARGLLGSRAR